MTETPSRGPSSHPQAGWPPGAAAQAEVLLRMLSIGDRNWHAQKTQAARRGAEQLASALVLLLNRDRPHRPGDATVRHEAIELVEHALAWLKEEVRDPGCPSHGAAARLIEPD